MKAARPPVFCACAMICSESVVLPEDSGPKISTTRPRGMPPTPRAASTASEPVGITAMTVSGLVIAVVGVPAATRVARAMAVKDPGCVVVDEFAGQFLASCPVPLFRFETEAARAAAWIVSFLLFRLFDIWKPGPIHRLQELPDGLGIVIDDVLAGLLAAGGTVVASTLLAGAPWH